MEVKLLTQDATLDDLSASDYRDMFIEARPLDDKGNRLSLDKFIVRVGSQFSKALWGRYDHGEVTLNRAQRNELRAAFDRPLLPMTVADATAQASPDAAVWMVGESGTIDTVIMLAGNDATTLHVNGVVTVQDVAQKCPQLPAGTPTRHRTPVARPVASKQQDARRVALNAKWQDVIEAGLRMLEMGGI